MDLNLSPKPATPPSIRDGSTASFENDVIRESLKRPVVVDFWAPWCAPCKQLMPALEKHATSAGGKVALVKINIDQNPDLAQALRVQSVPTVYAFWQGQPVDGFAGAQGEAALKTFFDRLAKLAANAVPDKKADEHLAAGKKAFEGGDFHGAMGAFSAALDVDPESVAAKAGLARCLIATGEHESAGEVLADLGAEHAKHPEVLAAVAALDLAKNAQGGGDTAALEKAVAANPKDFEKRLELAKLLAGTGRAEEAIDHLLDMYRLDRKWNDEAARKQLLVVFDSLGPGHPLAASGRRRLSSMMFA